MKTLAIVLGILFSATLQPQIIHAVRANPKTIMVPDDYSTIQEAIDAASDGDTIFVKSGTYYGHVIIDKSLTLVGQNRNTTILDGNGTRTVVNVKANSVSINGFLIRNSGFRGINIDSFDLCTISNNILANTSGGIRAASSSNNIIRNNIIGRMQASSIGGTGIALCVSSAYNIIPSTNNTISNNTICSYRSGIGFHYSNNSTIQGNTIINNGDGMCIYGSGNTVISENIITNSTCRAIHLHVSDNGVVSCNNITDNGYGIVVDQSKSNIIMQNKFTNNTYGIRMERSSNNLLRNNSFNNRYNFGVFGWKLSHFIHDIDSSNTVNGKPIYYLTDQHNLVVDSSTFPEIGYLAVVHSKKITVEGLRLMNNSQGVLFAFTTNSIIKDVKVSENYYGIQLVDSDNNTLRDLEVSGSFFGILMLDCDNNTLRENIVKNNEYGIYITTRNTSSNNTITRNNIKNNYLGLWLMGANNSIYHNNFINNTQQVEVKIRGKPCGHGAYNWTNIWDDGYPSGGNYWSDYNGTDLYRGPKQDQLGSDGIGDTPYIIIKNNRDNYPYMRPISVEVPPLWIQGWFWAIIISVIVVLAVLVYSVRAKKDLKVQK